MAQGCMTADISMFHFNIFRLQKKKSREKNNLTHHLHRLLLLVQKLKKTMHRLESHLGLLLLLLALISSKLSKMSLGKKGQSFTTGGD